MTNGLSVLVLTLLGTQSVFALGVLLQAIVSTRLRQPTTTMWIRHWATLMAKKNLNPTKRRIAAQYATEGDATADKSIRELMTLCRQGADTLIVAGQCEKILNAVDGGARSLAGFLSTTAPLLGLAGTLLGISSALGSFSTELSSPEAIVSGFATAIGTTLWGVLIAFFSILSSRLIWQPAVVEAQDELTRLLAYVQPQAVKQQPTSKRRTQRTRRTRTGSARKLQRRKVNRVGI